MPHRSRRLMADNLALIFADCPDPYQIRAVVNSYLGYLSHLSGSQLF